MKSNSPTAEEYFRRGTASGELGNFKEAISELSKSIELNPNLAKSYNNRGIAKYRLGKYKSAVDDFNKLLELSPEYETAYNNRGITKVKLGDLKGALFDYSKAIEIDPEDALAFLNRAELRLKLDDLEGSIADYDTIIKLKPKSAVGYNGRALVKARIGDYKGATSDFDKAAKFKLEDKWLDKFGDLHPEDGVVKKYNRPNRKKFYSYDEKRDTRAKGYNQDLATTDYIDAILNLQLSTETYLRLRVLQKLGYKYQEASRVLDVPLGTLWSTTQRIVQKLKETMPSK